MRFVNVPVVYPYSSTETITAFILLYIYICVCVCVCVCMYILLLLLLLGIVQSTPITIVLMALFWAAIRRDSVSLLRFLFLSHTRVFSSKTSLVCRLKCRWSCFSSHFCFLVISVLLMLVLSVLFLVFLISLPPRFLCNLLVVVSMHRRYFECR